MNKKVLLSVIAGLSISCTAFAYKTHTIGTGDTLWDLAAKNYGDPTLYTVLLEVNNISNPRTILNGTVIIIPDKSEMQEIAAEKDPSKRSSLIQNATGGKSGGSSNTSDNSNKTGSNSGKKSADNSVTEEDTSFLNMLNKKIEKDSVQSVDLTEE